MQASDMELMFYLQKFALLFSLLVGMAIIVAAVALCFIARNTARIHNELLDMRIHKEMQAERQR